jgi:hypothetical protein
MIADDPCERHRERSEAIQSPKHRHSGLLHCVRNDDKDKGIKTHFPITPLQKRGPCREGRGGGWMMGPGFDGKAVTEV